MATWRPICSWGPLTAWRQHLHNTLQMIVNRVLHADFTFHTTHPKPRISTKVNGFCPENAKASSAKRLATTALKTKLCKWGSQGARSSQSSVDNSKQFKKKTINQLTQSVSLNCDYSWLITVFFRLLKEKLYNLLSSNEISQFYWLLMIIFD